MTCQYCGTNEYRRNLRGGLECCGCGHPPSNDYRENTSQKWWEVVDEIGPRRLAELRQSGQWEEAKLVGIKRYKELRKKRKKEGWLGV